MKSISLFTVLIVLMFFFSCKEQQKKNDSPLIIASGQMPAMVKDSSGKLHLVYGTGDSIMYTYSEDKGRSFSSPELVDTLTALVASATRGPQITSAKDGLSIIAADNTGNIFSFIKGQSGKWAKAARVNDMDTTNKEGFLGLSSDGNNNLFAIWPDLRDDGHNKIYGARSTDGGKSWSKNIMIYTSPDSTVCECCKPSVVMKDNNVYVMFRNFLKGNRDLYLIQSADGGNSFGEAQKLGTGNWQLDGCPMDGGGLAINNNGQVQTVWRREDKVFAAVPGAAEKEIGKGKGCTVETVNGKNIYAWADNNADIICLLPDGTKKIIGKGSLPLLKSISDIEVICIWQQEKNIKSAVINL